MKFKQLNIHPDKRRWMFNIYQRLKRNFPNQKISFKNHNILINGSNLFTSSIIPDYPVITYDIAKKNIKRLIGISEILNEAAYKGNMGAVELFQFYSVANDNQIKKMEKIVRSKNWELFKLLIHEVLGVMLI
jgi:hypothetical protein